MRHDFTQEEIIGRVAGLPLEFSPGEKFAYNNSGYYLLGMIVERASEKPYGEFLAERIFRPLGMTSTRMNDAREIIPQRADGYTWENDRLRRAESASTTQPFSAGALVSTVEDLARWDAALCTDTPLSNACRELMWTPTRLNDGKSVDYGFGWALGRHHGHRIVQHGGGFVGFLATLHRFVEDRLTVIVLTNLDRGDPGAMANRIARFYLGEPPPVEAEDPALTARLERLLLALAGGEADPARLTPEAYAALAPPEAGAFYRSLGPLRSFRLLEQSGDAPRRTCRYQARFGETSWVQSFVLNEVGQIAEIGVEPD
jgi:hypothetical protein